MRSDSFRRLAAVAGLASAASVAEAQIPAEVIVPLNATGYSGGVVYDNHGGQFPVYSNPGFAVPGRYPVERAPVSYQRYYPAAWYGTPGSTLPVVAPQVYMPTDTTQLGFYYQRVPTWTPVPGMIPGPPDPNFYHAYGYGVTGGVITDGGVSYGGTSYVGTVDGNVTTGDYVQPQTTTGTPKTPAHTPSGTTNVDPSVVPVPPSTGSKLPLQPPVAPAPEPSI